ncbi:peptidyl-prolyl cis-trans isomerase [uncultured Sanguibacteroides sp.]|uniref:peptidyl-prolyl cis-trans isomerase n=1 Tax=uncultured Sanguibacteroides sp. TaxID=1635151 RepID=UPI0025FC7A6A|nr:peptidyl-prolyl cis-trans isomerase [uncultured Sanguibacteroides sp.]
MKSIFILVFFTLFLSGCGNKINPNDIPVAKVLDKYLLLSEVNEIIPTGTSKADSTLIAQKYVRNWITKELLLNKALQNLSDKEKDIRKQVEEYSSSILIYKYKEKLISQKLEAQIRQSEIDEYYEKNKYNFVLRTPVVRAQLIIIPKSASNINNVRKWIRSNEANDQAALEEYCITNAKKYDNFNDKWIELRYLLNILPITQEDWEKKYKNKEYIEIEDDENYFFLKIKEILNEHDTAPADYVKQEIEIILRNKKKMNFEDNLEKQINEEGIEKNYVKIY